MSDKPPSEIGQTSLEVASLSGFMDWVQDQQKSLTQNPGEAKELFYRGHADERYQLQPSAYRKNDEGKSFRDVEYHLYQEMLRRNTEIFAEDKTTFERLVRMQHYGLPTRLLDVTQSALVALYFACEGDVSKNANGEVILFVHPQSNVLHPPAIPEGTVAGLDSLVKLWNMNNSIKHTFENACSKYLKSTIPSPPYTDLLIKNYNSILKKCGEIDNKTDFWEVILIVEGIEKDISNLPMCEEQFLKEFPEIDQRVLGEYINLLMGNLIKLRDDTLAEFCKQGNFKKYYGHFYLWDFLTSFCRHKFVFPPLNSERIRRQQGAFLLFPPIESQRCTIENFTKSVGIKISAKSKQAILSELAHLGITHSYLFPEPENQAKEITQRYPAR